MLFPQKRGSEREREREREDGFLFRKGNKAVFHLCQQGWKERERAERRKEVDHVVSVHGNVLLPGPSPPQKMTIDRGLGWVSGRESAAGAMG